MPVKLDHFPRDRGGNKTYTTQLWISLRNHLKPVPMEPPKQPSSLKITKNTTIFSGEFPNPLDSKPATYSLSHSLKLTASSRPARKLVQKETSLVFQPSIFRCYSILLSERVTVNKILRGDFWTPSPKIISDSSDVFSDWCRVPGSWYNIKICPTWASKYEKKHIYSVHFRSHLKKNWEIQWVATVDFQGIFWGGTVLSLLGILPDLFRIVSNATERINLTAQFRFGKPRHLGGGSPLDMEKMWDTTHHKKKHLKFDSIFSR